MSVLRLIIHAPTASALARARSNAANLLAIRHEAQVEIVINGPAVAAALDNPHDTDALLRVCGNTLARLERDLPDGAGAGVGSSRAYRRTPRGRLGLYARLTLGAAQGHGTNH